MKPIVYLIDQDSSFASRISFISQNLNARFLHFDFVPKPEEDIKKVNEAKTTTPVEVYLPKGMDIRRFPPPLNEDGLDLSPALVIFNLYRCDTRKARPDMLLLRYLRHQYPNSEFLILGKGNERDEVMVEFVYHRIHYILSKKQNDKVFIDFIKKSLRFHKMYQVLEQYSGLVHIDCYLELGKGMAQLRENINSYVIAKTWQRHSHSATQTARALGIQRENVYGYVRKYNLPTTEHAKNAEHVTPYTHLHHWMMAQRLPKIFHQYSDEEESFCYVP